MHTEARSFIARHAGRYQSVVEIGGRDVNGGVRDLFDVDHWTSIDTTYGPGVDIVADGRTWQPLNPVDLVVCCEVAEHCPHPHRLIVNAARMLKPDGVFLLTAAAPPREPHSAVDGGPLRDEYYRNIEPRLLARWFSRCFTVWKTEADRGRGDVYAYAKR